MGTALRLCALLMTVLFGVEVMALDAARAKPRDIFAPYLAIMPGQPAEALQDYPCIPQAEMSRGGTDFCQFEPGDGVFSQITVIKSSRLIIQTGFVVVPNSLSLGDAILCWGKPSHQKEETPRTEVSLSLYWDNQIRARVRPDIDLAYMDYFAPITYLSVEHVWKPVVRERLTCAASGE